MLGEEESEADADCCNESDGRGYWFAYMDGSDEGGAGEDALSTDDDASSPRMRSRMNKRRPVLLRRK